MQLTTREIVGFISFSIAASGTYLANMFILMMIGEINRKRPGGNLVSYFGFTFPKIVRIFDEYRRLYPNGKLHAYTWAAMTVMFVGMIVVAACIGIISI